MRNIVLITTLFVMPAAGASAQEIRIPPNVERLAGRAIETVNVTVDGALLQLASKFLSSTDREQAVAKSVISGLKGIYVRSFKFANEGEYSEADVESLRSQVKEPAWSKMVSVRSKTSDNVDVYFRMEKGTIAGLVVIAADPRELTFVNIDGPINLDQLSSLGGQFGIPEVDIQK
jgi:hypothetical protein